MLKTLGHLLFALVATLCVILHIFGFVFAGMLANTLAQPEESKYMKHAMGNGLITGLYFYLVTMVIYIGVGYSLSFNIMDFMEYCLKKKCTEDEQIQMEEEEEK